MEELPLCLPPSELRLPFLAAGTHLVKLAQSFIRSLEDFYDPEVLLKNITVLTMICGSFSVCGNQLLECGSMSRVPKVVGIGG